MVYEERLPKYGKVDLDNLDNVMTDPRQFEHLTDTLRARAIHVVSNVTLPGNTNPVRCRSLIQAAIVDELMPCVERGQITGYKVNITSDENYRLGERNIDKDAKPGDSFGKTGIILSTDGNGKGVVLDPLAKPPQPGVINVSIEVKAFKPLTWMKIEFSVGSND